MTGLRAIVPVVGALFVVSAVAADAQERTPESPSTDSVEVVDLPERPDWDNPEELDPVAAAIESEHRRNLRLRRACAPSSEGEIVVCRSPDADDQYRVPPDTTGYKAMGGPPRAPDVSGLPKDGWMKIGKDPEPIYYIDFSKLPDIDQAYLKRAREAEAAEKARTQDQGESQR